MRKLKVFVVYALVSLLLVLTGLPVYAQVQEPSGTYVINTVEVYRSVLELEDQLWLITGTIDYTTNPSRPVDETYIVRIMNGAVEVATTTFYPYEESGYSYGTCSVYFNKEDAPDWTGGVDPPDLVKIEGNPTLQWMETTASTAMGGAVAYDVDDGTPYDDETTEANEATANDMNLLPAGPAINDAYYFGSTGMFDILTLQIGTAGDWTGSYTWEYWDGDEWTALSGLTDGTVGFTAVAGYHDVTYTCPEDWQTTTISAMDLYWIRMRVTAFAAVVQQPFGTQSWTNTMTNPPSVESAGFNWIDEGSVSDAQTRLTTRIWALAYVTENAWGGTTDLISLVAGVSKLTDTGEEYFTNSIANLRTMCPDLFADVIITPEFPEEGVTFEYYTEGGNIGYNIYGVNWCTQTFTCTSSYAITGLDLKLYRVGEIALLDDVTISIKATVTGQPSGADLAVGTLDSTDFTTGTSGEWYEVSFTDDYTLTNGEEYAIVIRDTTGDADNYINWMVNGIGEYENGRAFYSTDSGGTWTEVVSVITRYTIRRYGYAGSILIIGVGSVDTRRFLGFDAGEGDFMFIVHGLGAQSMSYRDKLAGRLVGTRFDMTDLAERFGGMSRMWLSTIVWIVFACLIPVIFVCRAVNSFKPALLFFAVMLPFGAIMGFIYLEIAILAAFLCGATGLWVLFYKTSP